MKPLTVDTILGPLSRQAARPRAGSGSGSAFTGRGGRGVVEVLGRKEQLRQGTMAGQAVAGATAGTAISSATHRVQARRAECPVELKLAEVLMLP
jgi:hypothetical protein